MFSAANQIWQWWDVSDHEIWVRLRYYRRASSNWGHLRHRQAWSGRLEEEFIHPLFQQLSLSTLERDVINSCTTNAPVFPSPVSWHPLQPMSTPPSHSSRSLNTYQLCRYHHGHRIRFYRTSISLR